MKTSPHPKYPNYLVTDTGKVKGPHGKWLKPDTRSGYLYIGIYGYGKPIKGSIHVLVCETFHGLKPKEAECVRHLDGNKLNNHYSNLKWGTHSENVADSIAHGTKTRLYGLANGRGKLSDEQVTEIIVLSQSMTRTALAVLYGVSQPHISDIVNGKKRLSRNT